MMVDVDVKSRDDVGLVIVLNVSERFQKVMFMMIVYQSQRADDFFFYICNPFLKNPVADHGSYFQRTVFMRSRSDKSIKLSG